MDWENSASYHAACIRDTGKKFYGFFYNCNVRGGVLLGGRLICNDIREVFDHPYMVIVLSALMCLYNCTLDTLVMWTISIIYGYSLFMYLLMMNITKDLVYNNKKYNFYIVNILGFLAGISHELIGCWFILQIIFIVLTSTKFKNLAGIVQYYIGLIAGYCLCFFAPGNFNRLRQSHDSTISNLYHDKLLKSVRVHLNVMTKYEGIGRILCLFAIASTICAFCILITKHKYSIFNRKQLFFAINIATSIFLWAFVSYTPGYGCLGALLYFILSLFVLINEIDKSKVFTIIVIIVLFCVVTDNTFFMNQFVRESQDREAKVAEAVKHNESEVHIKAYSPNLNRKFLLKEYVDNSQQYAEPYYIKYYGTKIVFDEE